MDMANDASVTAVLPAANPAETLAMVREILVRSDEPLGLKAVAQQMPAAARPALESLTEIVREAVRAGQLFEFPELRGQPTFWDRAAAAFAALRLKRLLQSGPRTKSEVLGAVSSLRLLNGLAKSSLETVLNELLSTRAIQKLPPYVGARTPLLSLEPARSPDYLRNAFEKVAAKLGLSSAQLVNDLTSMTRDLAAELLAAAPPDMTEPVAKTISEPAASSENDLPVTGEIAAENNVLDAPIPTAAECPAAEPVGDLDTRLIQGALEINPRVAHGDMVLVAELRGMFDFKIDKTAFDKALLRLAGQRRIALHRFDRPWLISETERDQLVRDDEGHFYNTLSFPDPT